MHPFQSLLPLLCIFLFTGNAAASDQDALSDSLQHVLSHTSDPAARIGLLLNLKDLNEETELNVPLSIQLFREAAAAGDTYAVSAALIPILNRYSTYAEKEDSLRFYIRTLRQLTPGTPQEGIDILAEMNIAISRLRTVYTAQKRMETAREILAWNQASTPGKGNIYQHARWHILHGYASAYLTPDDNGALRFTQQQIRQWETAVSFIRQIPGPTIRMYFAATLYPMLGQAYTQTLNYPAQVALSNTYIHLLDDYFEYERSMGRRPYLYADNAYVEPYRHLIRCAHSLGDIGKAEVHYQQFRKHMLAATGANLTRNKTYLYEAGYIWLEIVGAYDRSLRYCDSLVNLIESGQGYYQMMPDKIIDAYRSKSRILTRTGRYDQACTAYDRAYGIMDSLYASERNERIATIRRRNEMDRMRLDETHAVIRSHITALICGAGIVVLLIAAGLYFYRGLRRNHNLQKGIVRLSRKAQESEQMKSNFLNSICNDIRAPFHAIDQAAWRLMVLETTSEERDTHLGAIRENTAQLLSTLDNMLEAASLGSLTEKLCFEMVDVLVLCRTELSHTAQQHPDRSLEYVFETTSETCLAHTHARYFSLVVRALLGNAAKFTPKGRITLRCDADIRQNTVSISVSDTGPGVAPDRRAKIFSAGPQNPSASHGQSLALCSLIAMHMHGNIRLDESYSSGARFIFTIPLHV